MYAPERKSCGDDKKYLEKAISGWFLEKICVIAMKILLREEAKDYTTKGF